MKGHHVAEKAVRGLELGLMGPPAGPARVPLAGEPNIRKLLRPAEHQQDPLTPLGWALEL